MTEWPKGFVEMTGAAGALLRMTVQFSVTLCFPHKYARTSTSRSLTHNRDVHTEADHPPRKDHFPPTNVTLIRAGQRWQHP